MEAIRGGDIPGVQIRCRREVAAAPEAVWRWLVEPGRLGRWLGEGVEGEVAAGGRLVVRGAGEGGGEEEIRVVERVEGNRWVGALERKGAGWRTATRVTVEVRATGGGRTEVSVLQEGFQNLPLSECLTIWEAYRKRWRGALGRLAAAAAGEEGASAP